MSEERNQEPGAGSGGSENASEDRPRGTRRRRRRGRRGYEGRPEWQGGEGGGSEASGGGRESRRESASGGGGEPAPDRGDRPSRASGRGSGGGGSEAPAREATRSAGERAPRSEDRDRNRGEEPAGAGGRSREGGEEAREGRRPRRRGVRRRRGASSEGEPGAAGAAAGASPAETGGERPEEGAGDRRGERRDREERPAAEAAGEAGKGAPGSEGERGESGGRERRRRSRRRRSRDRSGSEGGESRGGDEDRPAEGGRSSTAAAPAASGEEPADRSRRRRSGEPSRDRDRGRDRDRDRDRDRGRERSGSGRDSASRGGSRDARSRSGGRSDRGERGGGRRPYGGRQGASRPQPLRPTAALTLPPQPVRVMIAGGGTGGHIIPALSIGEALKQRNPATELLFLGSDRGIEREMIGEAGHRLEEFPVRGLPRRPDADSFRNALAMFRAYRRIRRLIDEFKPGVLVGTGGYVIVPAVIAAWRAKVPVVLQEQNSVPGRANRFLARFAREIHIHFAESRRYFKGRGRLRLSGNPVRVKISEGRALKTLSRLRLFSDRRTVLILGGSQGAHSLNVAFMDMLPRFRGDRTVQFVIQTGKEDYEAVQEAVRASGVRAVVRPFFNEMEELYGIANLVVGRAGAMTISEISACGLASILVPYPHAMDDHQTANAEALAGKDAAVILRDAELTADRLAEEIRKLLADPARLRGMARNAFALSRPDAAKRIAEAVEKLGGGAPQSMLHLPEEYDTEDEEAETEEAGVR